MSTNHHQDFSRHTGKPMTTEQVEAELSTIDAAIGALTGLTGVSSAYRDSVAAALNRLASGTRDAQWTINIDGVTGAAVLRFLDDADSAGTITWDGSSWSFSPVLADLGSDIDADSIQVDQFGLGLTPVGAQTAIADISETEGTFTAAERGKFNDILAALRTFGFIEGAAGSAPSAPTLNAISNADNDGDYQVDWEASAGATSYLCQVDDNSSFTSPATAYSGVNTFVDITGMADDTYYYRVRASNANGDSAWSSTQSVTVSTGGLTGLQSYVKVLLPLSGTGDASTIGEDASAEENDFTSTAYPDSTTGPYVATCADFDGSTEFLELASQALNTHQSATIGFWVRTGATWPASTYIFQAGLSGMGGMEVIFSSASGNIDAHMNTGGTSGNYLNNIPKSGFNTETWYFFAVSNKQTAAQSVLRSYIGTVGSASPNPWTNGTLTASGLNPTSDTMDATPTQDSNNPHIGSTIAEASFATMRLKNFFVVTGALDSTTLQTILRLGPDFTWSDLGGVTPGWE